MCGCGCEEEEEERGEEVGRGDSREAETQSISIIPSTSAANSAKFSYRRCEICVSGASMPISDFICRYVTRSMPALRRPRS